MTDPDAYEQLRRLKNTIMGASHRLTLLSQVEDFTAAAPEMVAVSGQLNDAVRQLERVLSRLQTER